jgi:hypothetical protein
MTRPHFAPCTQGGGSELPSVVAEHRRRTDKAQRVCDQDTEKDTQIFVRMLPIGCVGLAARNVVQHGA